MRTCPFNGCGAVIPPGVFACRTHWFSLSKEQRAQIWWAYNAYTDDKITVDELRRHQQDILDQTKVGGHA